MSRRKLNFMDIPAIVAAAKASSEQATILAQIVKEENDMTKEPIGAVEMFAIWCEETGLFPSLEFDEDQARKLVDLLDHPDNRVSFKEVYVIPKDAVEPRHGVYGKTGFLIGTRVSAEAADKLSAEWDDSFVEPVLVFRMQKES